MNRELTPTQRIDFTKEQALKAMLYGLGSLVVAAGYYFYAIEFEQNPPKRTKTIFFIYHELLGAIGGAAPFAIGGALCVVYALSLWIRAKQMHQTNIN